MGMDPFDLRYKNIYRPGDTTPTGQTPEVFSLPEIFDKLRPLYEEAKERVPRRNRHPKRRRESVSALASTAAALTVRTRRRSGWNLRPRECRSPVPGKITGKVRTWGRLGTCHEALRPLGITPDQIKLVMNDTGMFPTAVRPAEAVSKS